MPTDDNVSVKEYNKTFKYKDLEIEIKKMWQLKNTAMQVNVDALGMIKYDFFLTQIIFLKTTHSFALS